MRKIGTLRTGSNAASRTNIRQYVRPLPESSGPVSVHCEIGHEKANGERPVATERGTFKVKEVSPTTNWEKTLAFAAASQARRLAEAGATLATADEPLAGATAGS